MTTRFSIAKQVMNISEEEENNLTLPRAGQGAFVGPVPSIVFIDFPSSADEKTPAFSPSFPVTGNGTSN